MASALIQISAVVSCAGIALRYVTQLIVVIWSLKADEDGRRHALKLLLVLRGERSRRGLPPGGSRAEHPRASTGVSCPPPRRRLVLLRARFGNRSFRANGHGSTGGALVMFGGRTPNPQIKRSTLVRNTRLTSNDAPRGCQESTRGTGSSAGSGPRPGPRRVVPPGAMTVTQRRRTGMEATRGFLPASPPSCAAPQWPCQTPAVSLGICTVDLIGWLTSGATRPRVTVRHP
jgi:hypothetical protein